MLTARELHELLTDAVLAGPGRQLAARSGLELVTLLAKPGQDWAREVIECIMQKVDGRQRSVSRAYHIAVAACEDADPDWPALVSMGMAPIGGATEAQRRLFADQVAGHPLEWELWATAQGKYRSLRRWLLLQARPGPGWIHEDRGDDDHGRQESHRI